MERIKSEEHTIMRKKETRNNQEEIIGSFHAVNI